MIYLYISFVASNAKIRYAEIRDIIAFLIRAWKSHLIIYYHFIIVFLLRLIHIYIAVCAVCTVRTWNV